MFEKYDGPTGPTLMTAIIQDNNRRLEDFGFLGTAEVPREVDYKPHAIIRYAANHLHINGKCVKNKTGVFCA